MQINIPQFMIETGIGNNAPKGELWSHLNGNPIHIYQSFIASSLYLSEKDTYKICIVGSPVYNRSMSYDRLVDDLIQSHNDPKWLNRLDSEFLVIISNHEKNFLKIISSRFVSPPFWYYIQDGCFIGGINYNDIWLRLNNLDRLSITPESFYDLLSYKRIFGHKTHDKSTLLIEPAMVLSFDGQKVEKLRYWRPDFKHKSDRNIKENAQELSTRISNAIIKKTSDHKRYALFLSGGMDTRTLLAHFAKLGRLPVCFTINEFENREVIVAKKLTKLVGADHHYLPFAPNHYRKVFEKSVALVGGMQLPLGMFLGFQNEIERYADIAFHGHGFDYLFQGMYIPAKRYYLFNRILDYKSIRKIDDNIETFFLENISYKISEIHQAGIIKAKYGQHLYEKQLDEITKVANEARQVALTMYDMIEYLTFYNIARHYSYPDHWGINTNIAQRTIAFDNDLFDFYQTLKFDQRFDARIMRKCLQMTNPEFARVISANTRYPIKASSLKRTGYQIRDYILTKAGIRKMENENPEFERMGLPLPYLLRTQLKDLVEELLSNPERLSIMYYLDLDGVRSLLNNFLAGHSDTNGQLIMALISIHYFLKQLER